MKVEIFREIEIPEGIEAALEKETLTIKGPEGELKKTFNTRDLEFEIKDKKIIMGKKNATKNHKKRINTNIAHIKNMINGIQKKFEYQLKIVFSHFPITIDIQGENATIKNFLGEKVPRKCNIPKGVDIKVNGNSITITSSDKELAGQAAANLERSTKVGKRDRRVFQDGIFLINKAGREI